MDMVNACGERFADAIDLGSDPNRIDNYDRFGRLAINATRQRLLDPPAVCRTVKSIAGFL
jgi:hypothetical protein